MGRDVGGDRRDPDASGICSSCGWPLGMMTTIDDPSSSSLLADYYPARLAPQGVLVATRGTDPGRRLRYPRRRHRDRSGRVAVGVRRGRRAVGDPDLVPGPTARARTGVPRDAVESTRPTRPGPTMRCPGARRRRQVSGIKSLPWLIAASAFSFGPAVGVTFWAPTFLRRHHDLTAGEAAGLFGFASARRGAAGCVGGRQGPRASGRALG